MHRALLRDTERGQIVLQVNDGVWTNEAYQNESHQNIFSVDRKSLELNFLRILEAI